MMKINWRNPITRGLAFFAPSDELGRDAVSGEAPTSLGADGVIRWEDCGGKLGGGFCFDTRGSTEGGNPVGWYWGTGLKNNTYPRGFYEKCHNSTGCTTMSWYRRESTITDWQFAFGVAIDAAPYYNGGAIVHSSGSGTDDIITRWADTDGSAGDDTAQTIAQDIFVIRPNGVDQVVGTCFNTGSTSRLRQYKNGERILDTTDGLGRTFNLDDLGVGDQGIMANCYTSNADPLDGVTMFNAIWNRELSATEVASLYENPWQIVEPRRFYVPLIDAVVEITEEGGLVVITSAGTGGTWDDGDIGINITGSGFV